MKIMIASDIHGSEFFCEKMLNLYKKEKAEKLFLLGDLLYHGPRNDLPDGYTPKGVIPMLNEMKDEILCVRGNCDAEVDQMVLDFPIRKDYNIVEIDGIFMFLTHGHIFGEDNLPDIPEGSVLLEGHTHIPKCSLKDGIRCLNPGSVSIPKGGSTNGVIIYENRVFKWCDLDGTVLNTFKI